MKATVPFQCVWCGYNLRGLPWPHTCPECGLKYDEDSRVWRPGRTRRTYFPLFGPIAVVTMWMIAFVTAVARDDRSRVIVMTLWAVLVAVCIRVFAKLNRRGRHAAVVPHGIVVCSFGKRFFVPWKALIGPRIRGRGGFNTLDIGISGRVSPIEVRYMFDSPEEMEEFIAVVNVARRRRSDVVH